MAYSKFFNDYVVGVSPVRLTPLAPEPPVKDEDEDEEEAEGGEVAELPTKTQAVLDLAEVGACVRAYLMETGTASTIDSVVSGEGRGEEDWG